MASFWAVPRPVVGQDRQDEIIQKLIARVEALEREVAALKQTAAAQSPAQPESTPAQAVPKQETAVAVETPQPEPEPSEASKYTFHGYADAGFQRNEDGASDQKFVLGEIDLLDRKSV